MSAFARESNDKASTVKVIGLIAGPLLFIYFWFFTDLQPGQPAVSATLAVALLMAVWWITEVVPLAVTSLIPVALFPLLGIMDGKDVSATYFNHVIFLFIGGFIVALAMQKWNLHKRIALRLLLFTGVSPARILLGFMFSTAFLSMWISNTATAMMMIPIVISVIDKLEESIGKAETGKYATGLLLGIAYSASIGGIATLVGTPPNLSFARIFQIYFPNGPEISFSQWFLFALPLSVFFFLLVWIYLYFIFGPRKKKWPRLSHDTFREQYRALGKPGFEEKAVLIIFTLLALTWLTRAGLKFGNMNLPGWSDLFGYPEYINDGTVAIFYSIILFLIPSRQNRAVKLMDWKTARGIPWNIVLLFGGGFALASGFKESGLSMWFGEQLNFISETHPIIVIFVICLMTTFLTELTSNTATTEMLLPILAGIAMSSNINPLLFMLPATLSASMAFMLPVATPPNAIIFGTNRIRMMEMARTGLILNIIGAVVITLSIYFISTFVFDININEYPGWAISG
ncbi:MAG: SLC13 family permease [Bacteroidales bacterium]|jgi:sodium-dependent dicarboxylate transporter 2/3/5|nr:SLC13 family permease [Bacteroidales bacterium]